MSTRRVAARARNDIGQYDDLRHEWTKPDGAFAALHWLAVSRRSLIPATISPSEIVVDLGCGGGLTCDGEDRYVHVGIDLVTSALETARSRGVQVVRGDVAALPVADDCAAVVVAGEILEHVSD
ncbi:MAG: class I SAM-dependent methyltransferase, partial [Ilumatobacteraceae bacterium]